MPERIQLSRKRGWKMPPNTVKVTRGPGMKWGNPFDWREWLENAPRDVLQSRAEREQWARRQCIDEYSGWITGKTKEPSYPPIPDLTPLRGKNLACWCGPYEECHADVLLQLANSEGPHPQPRADGKSRRRLLATIAGAGGDDSGRRG